MARQLISALPLDVDLSLYRGDDFTMAVTVTDPGGGPADLTGATATAQLRLTPDTDDPAAGDFTADISGNVVTLRLANTVAAGLPNALVWDLQLTKGGWITTLMAGKVTVAPDVTRP